MIINLKHLAIMTYKPGYFSHRSLNKFFFFKTWDHYFKDNALVHHCPGVLGLVGHPVTTAELFPGIGNFKIIELNSLKFYQVNVYENV